MQQERGINRIDCPVKNEGAAWNIKSEVKQMSDYITTYSGIHFVPTEPEIEKIEIRDIAHALSLICRGNGHVKVFFQ